MARNRQLIRELKLLQLLTGRMGHSVSELARAVAVSTRTIRRDLEAIEEAGIPLVDEYVEDESTRQAARRWRVYSWRQEVH